MIKRLQATHRMLYTNSTIILKYINVYCNWACIRDTFNNNNNNNSFVAIDFLKVCELTKTFSNLRLSTACLSFSTPVSCFDIYPYYLVSPRRVFLNLVSFNIYIFFPPHVCSGIFFFWFVSLPLSPLICSLAVEI